MKIFVTGVCGQLGHDVVNEAIARGFEAVGSDIAPVYSGISDQTPVTTAPYVQLDITDENAVSRMISEIKPDAVIHCAAWTAVDAAEDEANRRKVFAVNADGTRYIAGAAKTAGAKMVYISTDYVFDGRGDRPWDPDDDCYHPLNVYGQSKLEGELAVRNILEKFFIVRIAWVFGLSGNNFVKTMLRLGKNHPKIRVVKDQIGTPTYTPDLSRLLIDMVRTEKYGYYHATNAEESPGDYISWYDFAKEIFSQSGSGTQVIPVTTAEYGLSKAVRPFNSRLDKQKLVQHGFTPLPCWKDALRRYLYELSEINQTGETDQWDKSK